MRRHTIAILLLPLLAAACSDSEVSFPCPGSRVATFQFKDSPLLLSRCDAGGPAAGMNALYPDTIATFTGTISYAASGNEAALCGIRSNAEPLVGTQVADEVIVVLDTGGALLSACNPRCAVTMRQVVHGMLARGPGGLPSGFTGTLVDEVRMNTTISGADCSPCVTPCSGNYLLTGLPLVPR